ncbi:MAG: bifunctional metallophosphatase/5'-nucleotidase [Chitinophagaceae bacterium]|nr:MAG: bifunctional metallophosphatase/5'-nucleotidase [Chitinophagaceae bacterium]
MNFKIIFLFISVFFVLKLSADSEEYTFTLMHTSDEHSNLKPIPYSDYSAEKATDAIGGFARLATLVNEFRMQRNFENTLLLSSGDIMGGSPYAWLILDGFSPEIEIMQHIGYDAMTIGNHEFDYGPDILAEYFERAGYKDSSPEMSVISSNILIPEGHPLGDIEILENKIYTLENGLKVGIFGLLGEGALALAPYAEPVDFRNSIKTAKEQVHALGEMGADVIVAITHSGIGEDRVLAEKVSGIDILLGGHSHTYMSKPEIINGTILFHPDYYLSHLAVLEFSFDKKNKKLSLINEEKNIPYLYKLNSSVKEDPLVAKMVEEYELKLNAFISSYTDSQYTRVDKNLVYSDFSVKGDDSFQETPLGNFVTDAMRHTAESITGEVVDVALQGNGVIRANINPAKLTSRKGYITFFDIVTVSGLGSGPDDKPGYPAVSIYLTGKEIYNVLEASTMLSQIYGNIFFLQISGMKYTYDPGRALWLKVPVLDLPVPANKAVKKAELFTGNYLEYNESYLLIEKNEERLYHVVADYYIASFLPLVGDLLPHLEIIFKDKNGQVLELDETVIVRNGKELKVWETLVDYSSFLQTEFGGIPEIYKISGNRITKEEGIPLYVWSYIIISVVLVLIFLLFYKLIKVISRKFRAKASQKAA